MVQYLHSRILKFPLYICCDPAPADAPNSQELIAVILARGRLGSLGQEKKELNQQKW